MEIKKSPKADLQNKRGLLLEIGLIVALALVIAAFAYTPKEHRIEQVDLNYGPVDEQIVEITRQDQKPPEPPKKVEVKVIADLLQVVTNETKIATDINFAEFDEDTEVLQQVEVKEEIIEDDQPFLTAETMPSFQGGDLNTFRKWVQDNVRFPQIALENGISGRVVLSFVIEKDGRLTNIQVLMTPDRSLSEEAIRVLNKSPKWSPGKQRNQVVRIKYTLPVDFRMQN
ncbi:MAG: TonB family protein [Alistipes sp.]|jgi:protein TonB|uniref:energy transducer TonB n=1 Tax=unclassified Alistipes TaxID=2608932 RepID=UPI00258B6DE9|nr:MULTISPECIES: energy transducer TonB [unclassified Alistipes]MCI9244312.1 TonB family protein [Alistipes sp.]MCX4282139.1 TonB family protein [Alistipes sp.]HUN13589.1 TonB family protein [Alistipes sp.]